jgi:hypothetical protein
MNTQDGPVTVHVNGQTVSGISAGAFNASWHVNTPPSMPSSFHTFCADIDPNHFARPSQTVTLQPIGPTSNLRLQQVAYLYNTHLSDVFSATGSERQVKGAALQLAIWGALAGVNTVSDHSAPFFASITGHDQAVSQADQWLAALGPNTVGTGTLLKAMNGGQDTIGPPVSNVPEPSSLVLLVSGGLAGIGAFRFRLPKKRQA